MRFLKKIITKFLLLLIAALLLVNICHAAHVDAVPVDAAPVDAAPVDAATVDAAHVDAAHIDVAKLLRAKTPAVWNDLQAGKTPQNPAPPLLIDSAWEYTQKVLSSDAEEEAAYSTLETVLIHGQKDEKKWNTTVDQWVHRFEDALHTRNVPSSQKKAFAELSSTTSKLLHAIEYINGTTQTPISGLNSRQAVGILLSDMIEEMRMEASPFGTKQNPRAMRDTLKDMRKRQLESVNIIRGIFIRIPEAYQLLDETVVDIAGRNEKERGKGYFMNSYALSTKDGPSERQIKQINELYKRQEEEAMEARAMLYGKRMIALLERLAKLEQDVPQDVPDEHIPAQIDHNDLGRGVQEPSKPDQGRITTQDANPPVSSTSRTEELVYPPWFTEFPMPPSALPAVSTQSVRATSSSSMSAPTVTRLFPANGTLTTTVHPLFPANGTSTTLHPNVTTTEPLTTTGQSNVTASAPVPASSAGSPIAKPKPTWRVDWLKHGKRAEKIKDFHKKRDEAIGIGLGAATTNAPQPTTAIPKANIQNSTRLHGSGFGNPAVTPVQNSTRSGDFVSRNSSVTATSAIYPFPTTVSNATSSALQNSTRLGDPAVMPLQNSTRSSKVVSGNSFVTATSAIYAISTPISNATSTLPKNSTSLNDWRFGLPNATTTSTFGNNGSAIGNSTSTPTASTMNSTLSMPTLSITLTSASMEKLRATPPVTTTSSMPTFSITLASTSMEKLRVTPPVATTSSTPPMPTFSFTLTSASMEKMRATVLPGRKIEPEGLDGKGYWY